MTTDDHRTARLRVLHVCYSDGNGGAAIGARRSHNAMLSQGIDSVLAVVKKTTNDSRVIELPENPARRFVSRQLTRCVEWFQTSDNKVFRTLNIIPMGAADVLNTIEADIIQLHWVAADTVSISELAKLNKPIVWKLPDMWAFSGAEHYSQIESADRFADGYTASNRPKGQAGLDIDRWIWTYKKNVWRDVNFNIVGPSKWIADCARRSILFKNARIRHIPNPLDLSLYAPQPKSDARAAFGLPQDRTLVMFGALHATTDPRKGFQHLQAALDHLPQHLDPNTTSIVVMGADGPRGQKTGPYDTHYLGVLREEKEIVAAYCTADVFVLPCEMDNLPNVIKEATCCGVPCTGFDVGGMPDMIDHQETGYLAKPYDPQDLARGIGWVAQHATADFRKEVRRRAELKHAEHVAVNRYVEFYDEILGRPSAPDQKSERSTEDAKTSAQEPQNENNIIREVL